MTLQKKISKDGQLKMVNTFLMQSKKNKLTEVIRDLDKIELKDEFFDKVQ